MKGVACNCAALWVRSVGGQSGAQAKAAGPSTTGERLLRSDQSHLMRKLFVPVCPSCFQKGRGELEILCTSFYRIYWSRDEKLTTAYLKQREGRQSLNSLDGDA